MLCLLKVHVKCFYSNEKYLPIFVYAYNCNTQDKIIKFTMLSCLSTVYVKCFHSNEKQYLLIPIYGYKFIIAA